MYVLNIIEYEPGDGYTLKCANVYKNLDEAMQVMLLRFNNEIGYIIGTDEREIKAARERKDIYFTKNAARVTNESEDTWMAVIFDTNDSTNYWWPEMYRESSDYVE